MILSSLARWLLFDDCFLFEGKSMQNSSMKRLLNNARNWFLDMVSTVMPCTCKQLQAVCGIKQFDGKHICVQLRSTTFATRLLPRFSAESVILLSFRSVQKSLLAAVTHIAKVIGVDCKNIGHACKALERRTRANIAMWATNIGLMHPRKSNVMRSTAQTRTSTIGNNSLQISAQI